MLNALQNWLFAKTGVTVNYTNLKDSDQLSHVVGLLIKMGESDGDFSPEESARIIALARFDDRVSAETAIDSFRNAALKCQSHSVSDLLGIIKQELTLPQKRDVVEMLYLLMKTDDVSHRDESKFIAKVIKELELPENVVADAYKLALEKRAAEKQV